ncbi:MAG TPA: hypothetical protein VGK53_18470 [Propionicimonas sp.]|jgi:hypothetical protein
MGWRVVWLQAQIAGLVFSSIVWIVVAGLSPAAAAWVLIVGSLGVLSRNTRAGLWWRFGARHATPLERDLVHAAIVPVVGLRGRHQPTIWVGYWTGGDDAIMPTRRDLVLSARLLGRMTAGRLADEGVCAAVSFASGRQPVTGSALVAWIDAFCVPWHIVTIFTAAIRGAVNGKPLLSFAWRARWVVFAMAILDNLSARRWPALIGVALLVLVSAFAPPARRRWQIALRTLGLERVVADGFSPALVSMSQAAARTLPNTTRAGAGDRGPRPAGLGVTNPQFGRRVR